MVVRLAAQVSTDKQNIQMLADRINHGSQPGRTSANNDQIIHRFFSTNVFSDDPEILFRQGSIKGMD
jgi:hypothetical protein